MFIHLNKCKLVKTTEDQKYLTDFSQTFVKSAPGRRLRQDFKTAGLAGIIPFHTLITELMRGNMEVSEVISQDKG